MATRLNRTKLIDIAVGCDVEASMPMEEKESLFLQLNDIILPAQQALRDRLQEQFPNHFFYTIQGRCY